MLSLNISTTLLLSNYTLNPYLRSWKALDGNFTFYVTIYTYFGNYNEKKLLTNKVNVILIS